MGHRYIHLYSTHIITDSDFSNTSHNNSDINDLSAQSPVLSANSKKEAREMDEHLAVALAPIITDTEGLVHLRRILANVLQCVRFPLITPGDLFNRIEPTRVVSNDLLLEAYRLHAVSDLQNMPRNGRTKQRVGVLYIVSGVQVDIPMAHLSGWNLCFRAPYSDKTTSAVFDTCKGSKILVASKKKNTDTLALMAICQRSVVTKQTEQNVTIEDNGVYWYHWKKSFGFSDSQKIQLDSADTLEGDKRLSWHLNGSGGYRSGNVRDLNSSNEWEKLLFWAE